MTSFSPLCAATPAIALRLPTTRLVAAVAGSLGHFVRVLRYIAFLLPLLVAFSGCGRGPKLGEQLQAAGGAATLKQECAGFIRIFEQSKEQQYAWMARDTNFPPTIASFRPQAVSIERLDGVLMVDVRVSGGFAHHGLLVASSPTPPGFTPRRSSWSIWQIADGVFEYRE